MSNCTTQSRSAGTATRRGQRLAAFLAAWVVILAAVLPSTLSASASDESSFIAQVNSTRAGVGLPPLQPDVQLTNLARGWAGAMRDGTCGEGVFICHASPISAGVTHPWAKLGENVGTGPDVGSIMNAFVASPGHYANIIDPEFTHIGVGVVWDGNRMFTTHRFMKLQSSTPATTTTSAPTTTAAPATTQAPATTVGNSPTAAPTPTTAAPATTTTAAESSSDEPTRPANAQPTAVLEERAATVLDALARVAPRR